MGVTCVGAFPFHDERNTKSEGVANFDHYGCAPSTDEGGPEIVYRVKVAEDGFLSAAVYDASGVDVDVHLLSALDATSCLSRGDHHVRGDVKAGTYFIVVDSFVEKGSELSGAYQVDIGFLVPSKGSCEMQSGEMARVGDGGSHLKMPATGPIVREAHLVTQEEPPPYPQSFSQELTAHYALSQSKSGLVMYRTEKWAPKEGGGTFYGSGIGSPSELPVLHEGWYVNMYWTKSARPEKGTRMILRDPNNGSRAVVVAAGYESGPGNLEHVGGTPEETHFYMGTSHLDPMTIGIAKDPSLPLGPRICHP